MKILSFLLRALLILAALCNITRQAYQKTDDTKSTLGGNQSQNKLWRIRLKVSEHLWRSVIEGLALSTLDTAALCQGQKQRFPARRGSDKRPQPHLVPYLTFPELVQMRTALTSRLIWVGQPSGASAPSGHCSHRQPYFVQPFGLGESNTGLDVDCWIGVSRKR